jgi:hypothetical protein
MSRYKDGGADLIANHTQTASASILTCKAVSCGCDHFRIAQFRAQERLSMAMALTGQTRLPLPENRLNDDFVRLFKVFDEILFDECFHAGLPTPVVETIENEYNVTCLFCRGNIWNRFLSCKNCTSFSDGTMTDYFVTEICEQVVATGGMLKTPAPPKEEVKEEWSGGRPEGREVVSTTDEDDENYDICLDCKGGGPLQVLEKPEEDPRLWEKRVQACTPPMFVPVVSECISTRVPTIGVGGAGVGGNLFEVSGEGP